MEFELLETGRDHETGKKATMIVDPLDKVNTVEYLLLRIGMESQLNLMMMHSRMD